MKTQEDVMQYIRDCKKKISEYDQEIWKYLELAGKLETLKEFERPNLYEKKAEELHELKSKIYKEFAGDILFSWEIEI
jgi:hypothetical protein